MDLQAQQRIAHRVSKMALWPGKSGVVENFDPLNPQLGSALLHLDGAAEHHAQVARGLRRLRGIIY